MADLCFDNDPTSTVGDYFRLAQQRLDATQELLTHVGDEMRVNAGRGGADTATSWATAVGADVGRLAAALGALADVLNMQLQYLAWTVRA